MKEKPKLMKALLPRSASFSFEVKMLLLKITAATTDVENCLKELGQEFSTQQGNQITRETLKIKVKKFYSITFLNLPVLCWMATARELVAREEEAVFALRQRVGNLSDSLSQESLKHQQENSEEAFRLIKKVGHILEVIEPSMQQERKDAAAKIASEKEKAEEEEQKQWIRSITGHLISGTIGGLLVLFVGFLVRVFFP